MPAGLCSGAPARRLSCRSWWRRCSVGRALWRPVWGQPSTAASTTTRPHLVAPNLPDRCQSSVTGLRLPPGRSPTWPAAACLHRLVRVNASWARTASSAIQTLVTNPKTVCFPLMLREAPCCPPMGSPYLLLLRSKVVQPVCRPAHAWGVGSTLRVKLQETPDRGSTPLDL